MVVQTKENNEILEFCFCEVVKDNILTIFSYFMDQMIIRKITTGFIHENDW